MALTDEAVRELTALSAVVLMYQDLDETLNEICRIAVRAVPGAEGASLTAFSEKGPGAVAASDDWSRSLDEMQYAEHEGPCLDAARTALVFRVRDVANEPRWPCYMPRAVELGARSMMSLPLATEGKTIGALNVYARTPDAFNAEATSLAEIIAAHASLASQVSATLFRHRAIADQLREAMGSRAAIEQAKGILIGQRRCSAEDAFRILVRLSQDTNRKLHDVAQAMIAEATTDAHS
jgi:GAF domain-containing protein